LRRTQPADSSPGPARLGILGGTFNPPHLGHLICAQEAYLQLALDRVLWVPTGRSPFKLGSEEEPGSEHRLALCRTAVAGDHRFEVSAVEVEREGPSYTVDTLEVLHSQAPDSELFLILGGDVAAGLPGWREPERVLSLARPANAKRRGTARSSVAEALSGLPGGDRAEYFRMPRVGISSTLVRRRVRWQEPIRYLVPDAVAAYIEQHSLYGGPAK
jgi:nicotinate-nucleotide adenylyltransferase